MPKTVSPITEANLCWDENNQPVSSNYDDVYFSRHSGIDETRYVFLEQNHLPLRWKNIPDSCFTIGETGFGTGLNFLVAAKAWLEQAPSSSYLNSSLHLNPTLHFVSVEKHPVSKTDLQQALDLWPEFSDESKSADNNVNLAEELLQQYPPPVAGIHRIKLANNRIVLTLMYGDATEMFSSLKGSDHPLFHRQGNPTIDAWFLDGFAPAKNPEMWTTDLFQTMADLSGPGTTFSTFTAAGIVRRGLADVGFDVQKVPGFGHKRDMLNGRFKSEKKPDPEDNKNNNWQPASFNSPHQPPWYLQPSPVNQPETAIIIGGGIAGCSTAKALAERGVAVTLIERHNHLAQEASGNAQGILYPKLSIGDSPLSRFGLTALLNASRYYSELLDQNLLDQTLLDQTFLDLTRSYRDKNLGQRCGVLVLPQSEKDPLEFKQIAQRFPKELVQLLEGKKLDETAGIPLANNMGLFFPQLGWINPPLACQLLADHPLIQIKTAEVDNILYTESDTDNQWQTLDSNGVAISSAPTMVIACGFNSLKFHQTNHLPLKKIRGQITHLPDSDQSKPLKTVLCGESYIAPSMDGIHSLGATYNFNETSTEVRAKDHQKNLDQLATTDQNMANAFSTIIQEKPLEKMAGRAAFRCTTPDYLPIAGPVPKLDAYVESYQLLKKNARSYIPIAGDCYPGLYLNIGHGSRGLSYAPLCAESVASHICNQVPPLELDLRQAIHPGRFIIRDLKRNKR